MVSAACGLAILATVITANVALQRSYMAVEGYSMSQGDQLRVQDYIGMDCRRATDVQVANGSWSMVAGKWIWVADPSGPETLLVTIPEFYDSTTKLPVAPAFNPATTRLEYGGGTITISYFKSGTDFIRQVGSNPNAAKPFGAAPIATNIASFQVSPIDQSATNGTVSYVIRFSPRFQNLPGPGPIEGTTIYSNTFLRNAVARQ